MDFFPTICKIAGVEIKHEIDGIDIFPENKEEKVKRDDRILYFMRREGKLYGGLCYYAARRGAYKLVQNTPFEPYQFFNIETDPQEKLPLDEDSCNFGELTFELSQHIRTSGSIPWQKNK